MRTNSRRRPTPTSIALVGLACLFSYILGRSSNYRAVHYFPSASNGVGHMGGATASQQPRQRYAVANFVEGSDQIYGVYSIHRQLEKFDMIPHGANVSKNDDRGGDDGAEIVHVAVVPSDVDPKYREYLNSLLGARNVRVVDKSYVLDRLRDEQQMWKGTFNKLWLYNLTEFDKVIMFDTDVLVRSNIEHWFQYSTPCGIQSGDDLNWNSGAMVIRPDAQLFEQMLRTLPHIQKYDAKHVFEKDPLNNGYGDQDFITAFFLNRTNAQTRCVMPTESAVLDCSLGQPSWFDYYNKYRPWVYQTVHFACSKPWRSGTQHTHPFLCKMHREWKESIGGIEEYYDRIPPLEHDFLAKCPDDTADS